MIDIDPILLLAYLLDTLLVSNLKAYLSSLSFYLYIDSRVLLYSILSLIG